METCCGDGSKSTYQIPIISLITFTEIERQGTGHRCGKQKIFRKLWIIFFYEIQKGRGEKRVSNNYSNNVRYVNYDPSGYLEYTGVYTRPTDHNQMMLRISLMHHEVPVRNVNYHNCYKKGSDISYFYYLYYSCGQVI